MKKFFGILCFLVSLFPEKTIDTTKLLRELLRLHNELDEGHAHLEQITSATSQRLIANRWTSHSIRSLEQKLSETRHRLRLVSDRIRSYAKASSTGNSTIDFRIRISKGIISSELAQQAIDPPKAQATPSSATA
ncbi:MAG: hypothetical protein RLY57_180 [Candidatus Parcubacteria bacterium]|jgi:hypothetical protein